MSNLSFPWNLGHQLLLPLTPELSESELFLHPFVLFNYSLHSRAIIPPIHETVLNSTRKRTWFVSRGGKRGKKQKRRWFTVVAVASKRRVRETRNKNKEDRNVSKFVVSSAMGLNAYGIYANDSIFKPRWTVRTFLRYLSRRNRILKEEKLLEIEKKSNFSSLWLKIDRGLDWKVASIDPSCFLTRTQWTRHHRSLDRFFSTLRASVENPFIEKSPNFLGRLSDFQQIKFNEFSRRYLVVERRPFAARICVSAVVPGKLGSKS